MAGASPALPRPSRGLVVAAALLALGIGGAATRIVVPRVAGPMAAQPAYLLYPRLGLCAAPTRPGTTTHLPPARQFALSFRPAHRAEAIMPPALGETLKPEWLAKRPGA